MASWVDLFKKAHQSAKIEENDDEDPDDGFIDDLPDVPFKPTTLDMAQLIAYHARCEVLHAQLRDLLQADELGKVHQEFLEIVPMTSYKAPTVDGPNVVEFNMTYDDFVTVSGAVPARARSYFTPNVFALFPQDSDGRISSEAVVSYIGMHTEQQRLNLDLCLYDAVGDGFIRQDGLDAYVKNKSRTMAQLKPSTAGERHFGTELFAAFYRQLAAAAIMFFLDTNHSGRVSIRKLSQSPILAAFLTFCSVSKDDRSPARVVLQAMQDSHEYMSEILAAPSVYLNYTLFNALDLDKDGMLTRSEFARWNGLKGQLCIFAVERIFDEYCRPNNPPKPKAGSPSSPAQPQSAAASQPASGKGHDRNESGSDSSGTDSEYAFDAEEEAKALEDLNSDPVIIAQSQAPPPLKLTRAAFAEFCVAFASLQFHNAQAIAYFFRLLDCEHRGYVTIANINAFFRGLIKHPQFKDCGPLDAGEFASEMFDLVKPRNPNHITLKDLLACGCGGTVVGAIIHTGCFYRYRFQYSDALLLRPAVGIKQ